LDAYLAYGMDYIETEEAVNKGRQSNETEELNLDVDTEVITKDKGSGERGGSIVSTAMPEFHTANAPVSTAGVTISTVDPEMKEERAKEKGVAFKDVEDSSRPIERGEELAHKLHEEELAEIARIQKEKAAQEEASRVTIMEMFDEVQAGIDV
ncbi:hypothetical protein Tco_0124017, partial [Tanacetum coccineum]